MRVYGQMDYVQYDAWNMIGVAGEKTAINRSHVLKIMPQIWYNNEAIVRREE